MLRRRRISNSLGIADKPRQGTLVEAGDIVVAEVPGGSSGAHYVVGRVHRREQSVETAFYFDEVDHDHDKRTAIKKARTRAAGRKVFFSTQGSRTALTLGFGNYLRCPRCGVHVETSKAALPVVGWKTMHACLACSPSSMPARITAPPMTKSTVRW